MRYRVGGRKTPIGLDLGAHSIKAVQLVKRGEKWEAIAAACVPRAEPGSAFSAAELGRLVDVLQRRGFVGTDVNVAIQPAEMISSPLELPARAPGLPMEQIARAEFCRVNKVEPNEIVMSFWDLPAPTRAGRATYAIAVGCREGDAERYLDLIESAGLEVRGLDACGCAVGRACLAGDKAGEVAAILDLSWTAATLSILKSGVIVYDRRIREAGLGALVQEIANTSGAAAGDVEYVLQQSGIADHPSPGEGATELEADCRSQAQSHFSRAIEELSQAFAYAAHRYQGSEATGVWLTGGGALIPGVSAFFEDALKLPVKPRRAADVVGCPASLAETMTAAMLSATGLALFEPE